MKVVEGEQLDTRVVVLRALGCERLWRTDRDGYREQRDEGGYPPHGDPPLVRKVVTDSGGSLATARWQSGNGIGARLKPGTDALVLRVGPGASHAHLDRERRVERAADRAWCTHRWTGASSWVRANRRCTRRSRLSRLPRRDRDSRCASRCDGSGDRTESSSSRPAAMVLGALRRERRRNRISTVARDTPASAAPRRAWPGRRTAPKWPSTKAPWRYLGCLCGRLRPSTSDEIGKRPCVVARRKPDRFQRLSERVCRRGGRRQSHAARKLDGRRRGLVAGVVSGRTRCAVRTTCRAAATWGRSRTAIPASSTSNTPRTRKSSRRPGESPCRRSAVSTSRGCSRRWITAS